MIDAARQPDWLIRWPADRFFFDLLDSKAIGKRGGSTAARNQELAYLFESSLPVPIESVHAIFLGLGKGRTLAGAVKKEHLTELPDGALALVPESLPEFLMGGDGRGSSNPSIKSSPSIDPLPNIDPSDLNLLVGEFAPAPIRKIHRRRLFVGIAATLIATATLAYGMDRRIRAAEQVSGSVEGHEADTLHRVLGPAPPTVPTVQRRMALVAERRGLERTRTASQATTLPDVSLFIAAVLAAWPERPEVRIEHMSTTGSAVTIRGNAAEPQHAQELSDQLAKVPGFAIDQPQFSTARGRVSFTIRLRRIGEGGP